jgi:SNF2 family DNA or RNA helicase
VSGFVRTELRDHQVEAVRAMVSKKRYVVADGVGMGKTLAALAAFDSLAEDDPDRRMLVLANVGSLPTWIGEVEKHTSFDLVAGGSHNAEEAAREISRRDPHVVVLTYPSVTPRRKYEGEGEDREVVGMVPAKFRDTLVEFYSRHPENAVLVLEEAHYCKNKSTLRYGTVSKLVSVSEYVWALTATPILNRLEDLYYLMDLIIPGFFGTLENFYKRYTVRRRRRVSRRRTIREVVGYKNLDELGERAKEYMVKRAMKGITVKFERHHFDLSPEEDRVYLLAAKGVLDETEDERDFGARLPDLQLAVDGAVLPGREQNERRVVGSKEAVLLRGLHRSYSRDPEKAVIVFAYFERTRRRLEMVFEAALGKVGYERLLKVDAGTDVDERLRIVREFGPRDLLLLSAAGKESLNFGLADEMWLYDVPFSMGDVVQTIGRMTRLDSPHRDFTVHVPVARETIDEYKAHRVAEKSELIAKVLTDEETLPGDLRIMTDEELEAVRRALLWRVNEEL